MPCEEPHSAYLYIFARTKYTQQLHS